MGPLQTVLKILSMQWQFKRVTQIYVQQVLSWSELMASLGVRAKKKMAIYSLITSVTKEIRSMIRKTFKTALQFKMFKKVKLQLRTAKGF